MALDKATASIITMSDRRFDAAAGYEKDVAAAPIAAPVASPRTDRRFRSFLLISLSNVAMSGPHLADHQLNPQPTMTVPTSQYAVKWCRLGCDLPAGRAESPSERIGRVLYRRRAENQKLDRVRPTCTRKIEEARQTMSHHVIRTAAAAIGLLAQVTIASASCLSTLRA